jgi:oligosaccharyltransferase complex subunit alpha (ribophorin I)
LSSSSVHDFARLPQPVEKSGKTITYGPYDMEMKPFSFFALMVHEENNSPFITVLNHRRELWLSTWASNLAVEEHYTIRHDGAQYVLLPQCIILCHFLHKIFMFIVLYMM